MYSARISRSNPTAFVILIDQSGSMAEKTLFNAEVMTKAEAVSIAVNMLLSELHNRCRREEGYRDYYDIAVLGYSADRVVSLMGAGAKVFVPSSELERKVRSRMQLQRERRLPDGRSVMSVIDQRVWVEPHAEGKTPMYAALEKTVELLREWCAQKNHRDSYPPVVFNITDGEASDADEIRLMNVAQRLKDISTEDGNVLFVNIHLSSSMDSVPVLFPGDEGELPVLSNARLLYRMSSVLPELYADHIVSIKGGAVPTGPFRGVSYNACVTDLVCMMNIGSVSVTLTE